MLICLFPSMDFYALHTFWPARSSSLSLLSMVLDGTQIYLLYKEHTATCPSIPYAMYSFLFIFLTLEDF